MSKRKLIRQLKAKTKMYKSVADTYVMIKGESGEKTPADNEYTDLLLN